MKSLLTHLLLLAFVFLGVSCEPTEAERRKKKFENYKQLKKDSLNQLLCKAVLSSYLDGENIRALVDAGADPNFNCHSEYYSRDLIDMFLGRTGYITKEDFTPMQIVFKEDSVELLRFLGEHGGKFDGINISSSANLEMWKFLFTKKFTVDSFAYVNDSVITNKALVQFLLDKGWDINKPFPYSKETISMQLARVIAKDDTTQFQFLLSKGADLNFRTEHSDFHFPLFYAVEKKQPHIFFFLLRNGGIALAKNKNYLLLYSVVENSKNDENYDMVKTLVDLGVDVNERRVTDMSSVYNAIKGKNPKILGLLLDHGIEFRQYTTWSGYENEELNPFEIAVDECSPECLKMLLQRYPQKADKKKLLQRVEYKIKDRPDIYERNPKCRECRDILSDVKRNDY